MAVDFHGMKINALYLFICRQVANNFPHVGDDIHSQFTQIIKAQANKYLAWVFLKQKLLAEKVLNEKLN